MKNPEHNSLRLVIFDEAFDKIDSSRIEEFINMLKTTGFQFIVSAPNEKAPYIVPLVETTFHNSLIIDFIWLLCYNLFDEKYVIKRGIYEENH